MIRASAILITVECDDESASQELGGLVTQLGTNLAAIRDGLLSEVESDPPRSEDDDDDYVVVEPINPDPDLTDVLMESLERAHAVDIAGLKRP